MKTISISIRDDQEKMIARLLAKMEPGLEKPNRSQLIRKLIDDAARRAKQ